MVKSYTGVRKAPEKSIQQFQVRDFMTTKLVVFRPDQPIGEVASTLMTKNISGGPVVDANNELVGIISEGDCLKEIVRGKYLNAPTHGGTVADHMVREVHTTTPEMSILELAQRFLNEKVRRFPVMEDGKLIGQISQRDVLRAVDQLKKETW
jgi:predicted transcriptional regulator